MNTRERDVVVELADALWGAEVERAPIAPITEGRPDLTVEDAYAIQTVNVERRVASGAVVRGRKVGLTSEPMQRLLGVNEPDFGVLLDDMFTEDGDEIALESMLQPRVEAELAFVMAALDRDRRQPDRGLADHARRHRRGQRLLRSSRPRRQADPRDGAGPAVDRDVALSQR